MRNESFFVQRFWPLWLILASLSAFAYGERGGEAVELNASQAVAMAISASIELKSLRIKQSAALQQYQGGIREYLPKVGLKWGNLQSIVEGGPDTRTMSIGLSLSQMLFDGNRLGRQRQIAALELSRYDQVRLAATRELSDQVCTLARRIELQSRKLSIQTTTILLAGQQASVARKEFELGAGFLSNGCGLIVVQPKSR